MHFRSMLAAAAAATLVAAAPVSAQTTLNVVTAGDQNMVDYVNNYLGPKFEKMNPGVKVRAVGTGPGDSGSQKIYEKLSAQQKAGTPHLGRRRRRRSPARCRDDGQRKAAAAVPQ
jgi:ABC-type glycerol-3-phosphate transport system substrate-binding protein